jgi:hypothetical protein
MKQLNWFRLIGMICFAFFIIEITILIQLFIFSHYPNEMDIIDVALNLIVSAGTFYFILELCPKGFLGKEDKNGLQ